VSDPQPLEQARAAVHKILEALQIARVVCVDDTYDDEPLVEEVVTAACTLDQSKLQEILSEFGVSVPDDQDVLKERIRRLWDDLDEPSRAQFAKNIGSASESLDDVETNDLRDAVLLSDYIPAEMLLTLSPRQWERQREQLSAKDAEERTLFLFDQDLSKKEGGEVEGGIKIIASLLARDDGDHICGLLTHTVSPDDLFEKWAELSKTYSINRDRFLVIPKRNLSETPLLFAQALKLVALSPDFTKLKERTQNIIQEAATKAASRVDEIRIYDLEHMVFTVAASEGMWEPDMLFRLHALFHRLESRQLAHSGGELERITRRLRSVSHIQTDAPIQPSSDIWKIQKDELYELPEHLNRNHFPLELGDIFVKTGTSSQKHYILLAQPCDLMVRSNGQRQPEIEHVPVAEVVKVEPKFVPSHYTEKMAYYGDSSAEQWYVKLKQVHQVKVFVLDLCVFNDDGSATIQLGGEPSDMIRPSWKARYQILTRYFRRIASRIDLLTATETDPASVKDVKARLKSELTNDLLNDGLCKGTLVDQDGCRSISYNCRRVGRLSSTRAFGLLMAYTSCLGRPAYDRDLV
jgi:hypothetical protein